MAYGIQEVGFLLEGANWCAMLHLFFGSAVASKACTDAALKDFADPANRLAKDYGDRT